LNDFGDDTNNDEPYSEPLPRQVQDTQSEVSQKQSLGLEAAGPVVYVSHTDA